MTSSLYLLAVLASLDSTAAAGSALSRESELSAFEARVGIAPLPIEDSTVQRPRARAVEISDSYAWKFRAHRIGSYLIVPLFAAQYALGSELLRQKEDVYFGRRKVGSPGTELEFAL